MFLKALVNNKANILGRGHLQSIINVRKGFLLSLKPRPCAKLQALSVKEPQETKVFPLLVFIPPGSIPLMADARYCVEYAKTGRSGCKKCKQQIDKGVCRVGKITNNPFSDDGGEMKAWHHTRCIFETFKRARATTKKIETPADLEGFPTLKDEEKAEIKQLIQEFVTSKSPAKAKAGKSPRGKKAAAGTTTTSAATGQPALSFSTTASSSSSSGVAVGSAGGASKGDGSDGGDSPLISSAAMTSSSSSDPAATPLGDNSFYQFCRLCENLEKEPSYNAKTKLVAYVIKYGNSGGGFTGDVYLLVKLLLPTAGKKRVYNLQSKQIVKLLSQVFGCSLEDMVEDLEQGDVAETARSFFEESSTVPPAKTSTLTLAEVDSFLDRMTALTKEDEQRKELSKTVKRCTAEDLKYIIRLIKHDLRINAGAKHVLDALDPNAYAAFQASNDLRDVVDRVLGGGAGGGAKPGMKKTLSIRASVMTPVKPMLAEACRSVGMAMKKCPNGMFAEIKYDGERVQVHKQGTTFQFFSRSLKPVQPHKLEHIKDYLAQACPHGDSMILDSEVLMVDNSTGKPLPFGTLGIHKKSAFKDASCCLFIFDIVHFNGETLMNRPIQERRKLLEKNISEVKNRIMLSEQQLIRQEADLSDLIMTVIKQGLEGLVLKDTKSIYEPGKRHWLKVKKDYLQGGAMADTADLLVLGAYYGTGNKGGMMSVFLMGVYDKSCDKFRTVAKCGNGHDDSTIARLQKELDMTKISKDASRVPSWLLVSKTLIPDFVIKDPKSAPVWEITGAEFSSSNLHTADGISVRFPRVTRIRDDKDWTNATDLHRLKTLFKKSKETTDIPGLKATGGDSNGGARRDEEEEEEEEEEREVKMDTTEPPPAPPPATGTPSKKERKRKRKEREGGGEEEEGRGDPPPASKRPAASSKPVCKYGAKCYLKSAAHKAQFDHPWDSLGTRSVKCAGLKVENPLLDLFTGLKVYITPRTGRAAELARYLTAYDAEVLQEHQKSLATVILSDSTSNSSSTREEEEEEEEEGKGEGGRQRRVQSEWVWDSLKSKQQLPVEKYLVKP